MEKSGQLKIIKTADGSHSLEHSELDETYHSRHGAVQEALHVFLEKGLKYYSEVHAVQKINILECGFGTGLNAILTKLYADINKLNVNYVSLEPFPIEDIILNKISFNSEDIDQWILPVHQCPWGEFKDLSQYFKLKKIKAALMEFADASVNFDLVYYDAFGPRAQPEMWIKPVFEHLRELMHPQSVLVTYCAKGQVRRDLESSGYVVERLDGPPGKREMLRATLC